MRLGLPAAHFGTCYHLSLRFVIHHQPSDATTYVSVASYTRLVVQQLPLCITYKCYKALSSHSSHPAS